LECLPGIGPVIARRIIEGRPYGSVEELDRIKGIGRKRLEEIRAVVTADHPAPGTVPRAEAPGRGPQDRCISDSHRTAS
jgi:hypothetical protein